MSRSTGVGLGGVLIGLGVGWMALNYLNISWDYVPYLLILVGVGVIGSSLIFKGRNREVSEVAGGIFGGLILAVVFSSVFGFNSLLPFGINIGGSGNVVDKAFDISDFTIVEVSDGFNVNVVNGPQYKVTLSVDENIVDYLSVYKSGNKLMIGLKPGGYTNVNLRADIVMPSFNGVTLHDGSHCVVNGLNSDNDAEVTLTDGSGVTMSGSVGNLRVDATDGSQVNLSSLHAKDASVRFSSGSHGSVYATGRLDVDLRDGSHLDYYGNPTLGNIRTSGGASLTPR
jgi:hypothetical protein